MNRAETAISGKVCKNVPVFYNNSGNGVSVRVIRGRIRAELGNGMQVPGECVSNGA